jgi:lipopolysaccharide heptosyltransferase II
MFSHLQIPYTRERLAVGALDVALAGLSMVGRLLPGRRAAEVPDRILLLRLERIGDLLMSGAAIEAVRSLAPEAAIDLVVGSWNADVARCLRGIGTVHTLDAPWLARGHDGAGIAEMRRRARAWRGARYDLAINFEGDFRSHALMAMSGAAVRVGFDMAGGGPLLTTRVPHDPAQHTAVNAARLVEAAFGRACPDAYVPFRLGVPEAARAAVAARVPAGRRLVALHASGGRAIKQWDVHRFAEAAATLASDHDAMLVLTGAPGDAAIVGQVRRALPPEVDAIDISGSAGLLEAAAWLERCDLLVTGDTGPMHLAAAVGTPVVAVFGPSDPARYAPRVAAHRVVRIDLWCAPCNRIRRPPDRCAGHVPDCLEHVAVEAVVRAGRDLLRTPAEQRR